MVQATEDVNYVSQDIPQAIQLLQEMGENIYQVTQLVDTMLARVKRGEISTAKGLSFLEVKYQTLLSYLINLTYVILCKCSGEKIEGDPAIDHLVELRTVMEKIRPIDRRLKYEMDKLVKAAVSGGNVGESSNASQFRANPNDLISKFEDEDDDSEDDEEESKKPSTSEKKGLYVPPKLAPMHFDGDETCTSRQEKLMERSRRHALSSSLVRELREEFMDAPAEMGVNIDGFAAGAGPSGPSRQQREQQEYEETYFTRLPTTKSQRHRSRKLTTLGTLGDELTNFGNDARALSGGFAPAGKRKRTTGKGKKGKKSSKKRKFH